MRVEPVVTLGLRRPGQSSQKFLALMEELRRLVETAGGNVVQEYHQNRSAPDPATLIGKGKIREVAEEIKKLGVRTVVFDDNLTAAQQKNVEKILAAKIVDRTRLILDIFAQRARTREGQLQVELAQLNYLVPRLTGAWRGFSQQLGGIGTRGPGERKIEVERRYVRERIKRLSADIKSIRLHRDQARHSRRSVPLPQVAIVGYTNVGKSTLLNSLVGEAAVYADDKLFATLDPTTRRVRLPSGQTVLLTDTVGFIQKLPTDLVAAFHATLEEVAQAALIVHVIDASVENWDDQKNTVLEVLKELNADHIPTVTAFNKSDLLSKSAKEALRSDGHLLISGKSGEGLEALLAEIERRFADWFMDVRFFLPHGKRHLIPTIYRTGTILSERAAADGTHLRVRIDPANWERLSSQLADGRPQ